MTQRSRKIEMTWVCTSCGHRNLGRFKECQQCGNPKDASERFEMPSDTADAATIADPTLLRHARAGADWRCTYCGTDNRALERRCVQCGSERGVTPNVKQLLAPAAAARPRSSNRHVFRIAGAFALTMVGGSCLMCLGAVAFAPPVDEPVPLVATGPALPRIVRATVFAREWRTTVQVDRRRIVAHEGFAEDQAGEVFDVVAAGERHHHDEQVLDHYETETYSEDVPYQDTETYTEQVQCGEDCHDLPESCSEHCSDDGNGFATCTTSCSGGGRSCTPRYCSETRTRSVTRTRSETRTRQVPRYRSEPRNAPWLRWRVWEWTPERHAERSGNEAAPTWPDDDDLGPVAPLGENEEERTRRVAHWAVRVREDAKPREHVLSPPTLDDLARYPIGATITLETWWDGRATEVPTRNEPDAGAE